jgi:VCBS repeat-containing protein
MAETTSGDAGGRSFTSDASLAQIQLAQSSEPIGEIREIAGNVGLHRADGTPVVAEAGTPIYQDDSVVTGSDATVEIVFVDGMTFALGANGNVTIDKLIYNPGGDDNAIDLGVARGAFVFITGQVAPASGEGVNIETPAGVIGVRGTSGACADSASAAWTCAVLPDPVTNHVGRITLTNSYGVQVLDTAFESTQASPTTAPSPTQILTPAQATEFFGDPLSLLPEQFPALAPPNRERDGEPDSPSDPDAAGLNEINPAANGSEANEGPVDFAQMVPPAESLEDATGSESLGDMLGSAGADRLGSGTELTTAAGSLGGTEGTSNSPTASSSRDIPPPEDTFLPVPVENPPTSFSPTSDSNQTSEDGTAGPATGNVLSNDGAQGAARQVVAVDGSADNVGQPVQAKYGVLTLNADGSYTYALDNDDPEVQALAEGEEASDTISYVASNGTTSKEATLTITVTGTNDQPEAVDDGGFSTLHDQSLNITPASLTGNDQDIDGDTLTISSVTSPANGSAVLNDDGSVTYTPNAGYSGPDSFSYTISDGHGGTSTGTVTLEVIGNRPPSEPVDIDDASNTVAEGSAAGTLVGLTAQSTDPDLGDEVTYSLTDDAGGRFQIDAQTGEVSVKNGALLDFETAQSHQVTVQASDGKFTSSQTFTIGVSDVEENAAPVAGDDSFTTKEDSKLSGTVATNDSDADGDTLTFTLVGDPPPGLTFNPDGSFDYIPPADSNGKVVFEYQVTDGKGGSDTATVTIDVTPVNDSPSEPVDIDDASNMVAEGSAAGTLVGLTVQSTDPDLGDEVTYSLTDDADGRFQIDAATGEVSVKNGALLDFETAQSHQITVEASDGELSSSQTFTIGVGDVAENAAPVITSNGGEPVAAVTVAENGTAVTTVTATDPDAGQKLTFSIVGGADASLFAIDSLTGALSFVSAPDFEAPADQGTDNAYDVVVQVSDGELTDSQAIKVSVTNVNEAPSEPMDVDDASNTVAEGSAAGTLVGLTVQSRPTRTWAMR